jgi:outer membrane immunogenic protein
MGKLMKKYLLATTCVAALSGGAMAADLPMKAAPPAYQVPVSSWTGPYVGAHVGVARMNAECAPGANGNYGYYSCGYGSNSLANRDTGVAAGIHAGYDWQDGSFVYGVVADWTWTDLSRNQVVGSYTFKAKVDWLASFRGRMGLAIDRTLVYVTGGLALGAVSGDGNYIEGGYQYSPLDKTAVGWVAGVGVEHKLASMPRWSVNSEFLYYDLGRHTGSTYCQDCSSYTYQNEYNFEVFEARIGLNYRF